MLWKFFCWPAKQIPLGANSKDQIKFVHYDIMRKTIWNSPKLLRKIGRKKIKIKDITIRNQQGDVVSSVWCVSSFSGIFSNINGYTFSEIYAMKNEDFFNEDTFVISHPIVCVNAKTQDIVSKMQKSPISYKI